ncbi:MAG: hypothetical protein ABIQ44_04100 [Chloroflexia bacterium]
MTVNCPSCNAPAQEIGKFCENCGFFINEADAKDAMAAQTQAADPTVAPPASPTATPPPSTADPAPVIMPVTGVIPPPTSGIAPTGSAQFAVVISRTVDASKGFTITRAGEYLVGRSDTESNSQADIDVRQWVQPMDIHGTKQYLVHRKQCYLALTPEGAVTIRSCPGAELDTMIKAIGTTSFSPIANFATVRPARPDTSFELEPGDQIFMGDPDALPYYQHNAPTAAGSYLVLELLPRA